MTSSLATRSVHSYVLHVAAAPERVFPLLCPTREYDWLDGWSCDLVYSESGVVERGCIFVTDRPPEGRTLWVTAVHEPAAHRVEFVRVTPDSHVVQMALRVERDGAEGAAIQLTYTLTGLTPRGNSIVAHLSDGRELRRVARTLEGSLAHFLATGEKLAHGRSEDT